MFINYIIPQKFFAFVIVDVVGVSLEKNTFFNVKVKGKIYTKPKP